MIDQIAVRNLIKTVGDDPDRPDLVKTPERVARMYAEILDGYGAEEEFNRRHNSVFETDNNQLVIVKQIEVFSVCGHHLLPFYGYCTVGYLPDGKVLGLSKFARVVRIFAHRLQKQEDLTEQIAQFLHTLLTCKGVMVMISCKHLCCVGRGVKEREMVMTTSAIKGEILDGTRQEILTLGRTDDRF